MKVTAGVLTWNPVSNGRLELLAETVASLAAVDQVTVFDNGSTDDWSIPWETTRLPKLPGYPHGNTCGYGMNKMSRLLDGDIVILSNDDIAWKPGAIDTLREVWAEATDDVTIISGLVEPTFALPGKRPWNEPVSAMEIAGRRLLTRRSVPGGAWTYRQKHRDRIFPVSVFHGIDDVPACHRLVNRGFKVACLDLADHAGLGASTWGNASHERFIVTPVEDVRAEYGL